MADSTLIKHIGSNPSNILPQLLMLLPNREHPMQRIVNQMFTPPYEWAEGRQNQYIRSVTDGVH